jgi:hypothetical protein
MRCLRRAAFDLVACVNAIHHFGDPRRFVDTPPLCCAAQGPGDRRDGSSAGRDHWYLYDYFQVLPPISERYHTRVRRWMQEAGLERVTTRVAQRIAT